MTDQSAATREQQARALAQTHGLTLRRLRRASSYRLEDANRNVIAISDRFVHSLEEVEQWLDDEVPVGGQA